MRARDILSANLRTLIENAREEGAGLTAIKKVAEASGGRLTNGTVGRIAAGSHPTNIDALTDLAEVFGLQPWQLLVENLNPKALPRLADAQLLSQIRKIVESVPQETTGNPPVAPDELRLQKIERRPVKVGPALSEAFNRGAQNNARSGGARAASKQKGSRRR